MDIFEACETGNLDWLKQQKAAGKLPKLMLKGEDSWYPHEHAAADGHLDVVKWLVMDSGQPVDVTADENYSVRWAASNGHLDLVKWLVQESGQPVDVTSDNNEAVRWAARNGHLDVVKWLVQDSNQPVDVTADDNSAVRWAVRNGHHDVVDYLNFVTPLIQAVGLDVCRCVGFDAVSEMFMIQATATSVFRKL